MRDYRKLRVFNQADALLLEIYRWSSRLPSDEEYVLRSQIRRSALSVPSNIVEGSARLGEGEYVNHLNIALGSSAELEYLIGVAGRLYPWTLENGNKIPDQCAQVSRQLVALIESLRPRR
jgi:four helix bundle protein